ncbi:hypothetical protein BpHYR1_039211 [Brachionus plicatilis]|uniref:Uncharacterized protein n=1 Tax=Brachionus plicatilis TaxID=10195 RepID=A0A3M7QWV5_BRAPC|nr:hypothetical protein BpHYR1_039211 [Brachionus plicatilis]
MPDETYLFCPFISLKVTSEPPESPKDTFLLTLAAIHCAYFIIASTHLRIFYIVILIHFIHLFTSDADCFISETPAHYVCFRVAEWEFNKNPIHRIAYLIIKKIFIFFLIPACVKININCFSHKIYELSCHNQKASSINNKMLKIELKLCKFRKKKIFLFQ